MRSPCSLFPQSTATADELALFWAQHQGELKGAVLFLIEQTAKTRREDRRLDESHRGVYANGLLIATAGRSMHIPQDGTDSCAEHHRSVATSAISLQGRHMEVGHQRPQLHAQLVPVVGLVGYTATAISTASRPRAAVVNFGAT